MAVAALLTVVGIAALRLGRDLPRSRVERALAERLGCAVSLGALEVGGLEEIVLVDLEIGRPVPFPYLEGARIESLRARGSIAAMLDGRFDSLRIEGVSARLAPAPPGPASPAVGSALRVGRLTLDRALVLAGRGEAAPRFRVDGLLTDIGGNVAGTLRLAADAVDSRVAAAAWTEPVEGSRGGLALVLRGVRGVADVSRGGEVVDVSIAAESGEVVSEDRKVVLRAPSSAIRIVRPAGSESRISARARVSCDLWSESEAEVVVAAADGSIERAEARIEGIDLGALAALLPPSVPVSLGGRGTVRIERQRGSTSWSLDGKASLGPSKMEGAGWTLEATASTAELRGALSPAEGGVKTSLEARWSAPAIAVAFGGALSPLDLGPVGLDATWTARGGFAGSLAAHAWAGSVGSVRLEGEAVLERSGRVRAAWSWGGSSAEKLGKIAESAGIDLHGVSLGGGAIAASGRVDGTWSAPAFEASVTVGAFHAVAPPVVIDGTGADADLRVADLRIVALRARSGAASLRVRDLPAVAFEWDARGLLDLSTGRFEDAVASLRSGDLGTLRLKARGQARPPFAAVLEAAVDELDLARWHGWMREGLGDLVPGYAVSGVAGARLDSEFREDGSIDGTIRGTLREVSLASLDGTRVLEGLDTTLEGTVAGSLGAPAIEGSVSAAVGGFQLLWESWFVDGSDLTSALTLDAGASREGEAWNRRARVAWDFPGGPKMEASLALPAAGPAEFSGSVGIADVSEAIERYVRAPLGDSVPLLSRLDASGAIEAAIRGTRHDGITRLSADLRLANAGFAFDGGRYRIDGFDLDLPLRLEIAEEGGKAPRVGGEEALGRVRVKGASAAGLGLPPAECGIRTKGDTVTLADPIEVALLGGTARLERLSLTGWSGPTPALETGLAFEGIDLARGAQAIGILPLEGTLGGSFPSIRLTRDRLRVEGGGEIAAFGGRISVGDLSGENLFSRFPRLSFSASFRDIDLLRLTRRFDFGDLSGIARGELRDFELYDGVPVRFEALLETERRKGIPQTVNVKAIKNIAILGTGGRVSAFDRGIHRLFQSYRYEALRLRMSLADDVFVIRGIENPTGREYFLKGAPPFSINVVNMQPGRAVSFRTMVDRFRSLDFSAAATDR